MSARRFQRRLGIAACAALASAFACDSETASKHDEAITGPSGGGGAVTAPDAQSPRPPSTPAEEPPLPGSEARVQLVGRFDTSDPAGPIATWPGSRILTRFRGAAISATLREHAEDWMDGAPSYWEARIDGGEPKVLAMTADDQPHVFELASGLPSGDHVVELYKRSEMQTGITQLLGFDLHGGAPLAPPPRRTRHIEAMADSYGTGYGIELLNAPDLHCPGVDHAGRWQNFRKAWPSLLAERFGADIEGTVYSGKGLTRGIWPTDTDGLIDYYRRANPNPAIANSDPPLFDLKSWVPDVIVLVQGTVDNGLANFRTVYRDFVVDQLRARAPNAHIFLVVPGRVARQKWIDVVESVAAERAAAGDLAVHAVIPAEEQPEEMTACGYHGSPAYHQRIADAIGAAIVEKVGW